METIDALGWEKALPYDRVVGMTVKLKDGDIYDLNHTLLADPVVLKGLLLTLTFESKAGILDLYTFLFDKCREGELEIAFSNDQMHLQILNFTLVQAEEAGFTGPNKTSMTFRISNFTMMHDEGVCEKTEYFKKRE